MTAAAAAVVLAGGRSTRMGSPKASLEWHGSTLLRRAAGIVARAVDGPVVVVRAPDQALPALPPDVEVTQDARKGHGPLAALAAGLDAIGDRAPVVFVTGVDLPLLHPAFVGRVLALLGPDADVALPRVRGHRQPLAAAYRTTVAAPLRALLRDEPQPGSDALLRRVRVTEIEPHTLLADPAVAMHDPALDSLANLNERAEYEAARARPAPAVTVRRGAHGPARRIHAATLGGAATATGLGPGESLVATVAGRPAADPEEPLVAGDLVVFGGHSSSVV